MNYLTGDDEYDYWKAEAGRTMKKRLGIAADPLDEVHGNVSSTVHNKYRQTLMRVLDQQVELHVPILPQGCINTVPYS